MSISREDILAPSTEWRPGWECLDQPLYDCATFDSQAPTRCTFFIVPRGAKQSDSTFKMLADTNLDLEHTLPKGQEFMVKGFQLIVLGATDEDLMRFFWRGAFELMIGSKVYTKLPLIQFAPQLGGRFDISGGNNLLLVSEDSFCVELSLPAPLVLSKPMRLCVELLGKLYRRVA